VEYYSVITGVPPEAPHRSQVDQDDIAEIAQWSATEVAANVIDVVLEIWDDDVKRWQMFARKGAWPTLDGTVTGDLDPDYRRSDLSITTATSVKLHLSTSTTPAVPDWYLILSPLNSVGEEGTRESLVIEVTGTATSNPVLNTLSVTPKDNGTTAYNRIGWAHNTTLESPQTTYHVKVYAYRSDYGSGTETEITSGMTRYPAIDVDSGADYDNTNDVADGAQLLQGSILHRPPAAERGGASPVSVTWNYRVDVLQGTTVIQTRTIQHTDTYTITAPSVSGAAAVLTTSGACVLTT